jgi:hypothetical protein
MEFLKSAVASAMAKGPPFPYTFGDKVDLDPSIWTLHNGTRRVRALASSCRDRVLTSRRRKTGQTAASSPSTSPRTDPPFPLPGTP